MNINPVWKSLLAPEAREKELADARADLAGQQRTVAALQITLREIKDGLNCHGARMQRDKLRVALEAETKRATELADEAKKLREELAALHRAPVDEERIRTEEAARVIELLFPDAATRERAYVAINSRATSFAESQLLNARLQLAEAEAAILALTAYPRDKSVVFASWIRRLIKSRGRRA